MNKYISLFAVIISLFCVSCSETDNEFDDVNADGKYVLPFKVSIDNAFPETRLIFNGAEKSGVTTVRKLEWEGGEQVAFYSGNFTPKTTYRFNVGKDGDKIELWGDEALPLAANTSYTLYSLYPYERLVSASGTTLVARLPSIQNGTVNTVTSSELKGTQISCPAGQESSTYKAVNVTDYSCCLMYAFASITTGADKKPTTNATLSYRVRATGFDVIIDAPKSGSVTINEVDIETGSYDQGTKTFTSGTNYLVGTINNAGDNSGVGTVAADSYKSTKISLKFADTELTGTDRMVARLYGYYKNITSDLKITVKSTNKTYCQYIKSATPQGGAIIHFYLGQFPVDEEAVDLGLTSGTKWATRNLGATNPTDVGNYYAWAADKSVSPFSFDTYKTFPTWTTNSTMKLGKITGSEEQYVDPSDGVSGTDISGSKYDAASLELGSKWHIPTQTQWKELKDECDWTWNGSIITVTGPNGKSIKLPAAGYKDGDSTTDGDNAYYWTSIRNSESTLSQKKSYGFKATSSTKDYETPYWRYYGMLIRPVRD